MIKLLFFIFLLIKKKHHVLPFLTILNSCSSSKSLGSPHLFGIILISTIEPFKKKYYKNYRTLKVLESVYDA